MPDALVYGINPGDAQVSEATRVTLDGQIISTVKDGSDALYHGDFVANVIDVGDLEADFTAGLGASGLQGGAAGEGADDVGAPGAEDGSDGVLEAGAEGQQDNDGGDPPGHAEHGERGAAAVVLHGAESFFQQVTGHNCSDSSCLLVASILLVNHSGRLFGTTYS